MHAPRPRPERSGAATKRIIVCSLVAGRFIVRSLVAARPHRAAPIAVLATVCCLAAAQVAPARTYYISPSGHNHRSGRTPRAAWRTVDRVNAAHLRPGDRVLFRGGASFSDDTLMPGWGTSVSGRRSLPVVFGSYGGGKAWLRKGVWFRAESQLVFQHLTFSGGGIEGSGTSITIEDDRIANMYGPHQFGVNGGGSYWTIRGNGIYRTGDSGMLLSGDHFYIANNTISRTGLNPAVTWGAHGIYLKARDSTVTENTISGFRNEGISVRYRNSTITHNRISVGQYGIAWHQYDAVAGTSRWWNNTILGTSVVGIYISPHDNGGATREQFVISGNSIHPRSGIAIDVSRFRVRR